LSRSSSSEQSAAAQYAEQFSESAYTHISEALEKAEKITAQADKLNVIINLLILVDGLEDIRLAKPAIKRLRDKNAIIQYWAVHCVTSAGFIKRLNPMEAEHLQLAENITEELKKLADKVGPDTLALIVGFAGEVNIPQAEDLLLHIADVRISKYADWTVEQELLDGAILKLLDDKIPTTGEGKADIGRRFAQLYSYTIQRYVKGQDFLDDVQIQRLASVLVETELLCISKRLRTAQSIIKKAIEDGDYAGLMQEHNRLLGDETKAGRLAVELKFDYGKNADGSSRTAPPVLPEPPGESTGEQE
jgi:predicted DNA-binding protein